MPAVSAPPVAPTSLRFVALREYPALIGPVARIMTESSPIHKEARVMLTRRRMPSVHDHLQVVLQAKQNIPDDKVAQELERLRAAPAPKQRGDPLEHCLNLGVLEVVAIFTLLPPKSKALGSEPELPLWQRLTRWVRGLVQTAFARLVSWSTIRWGFTVPFRMSLWIQSLVRALEVGHTTDIYSADQHDLQTMCVAKHLQGQGLGSVVLKKLQEELANTEEAVGMQGLCQSESTKNFYVKTGFQAREVFTHSQALSQPGTLRKHWFVAWDVEYKNPHGRIMHKAE